MLRPPTSTAPPSVHFQRTARAYRVERFAEPLSADADYASSPSCENTLPDLLVVIGGLLCAPRTRFAQLVFGAILVAAPDTSDQPLRRLGALPPGVPAGRP